MCPSIGRRTNDREAKTAERRDAARPTESRSALVRHRALGKLQQPSNILPPLFRPTTTTTTTTTGFHYHHRQHHHHHHHQAPAARCRCYQHQARAPTMNARTYTRHNTRTVRFSSDGLCAHAAIRASTSSVCASAPGTTHPSLAFSILSPFPAFSSPSSFYPFMSFFQLSTFLLPFPLSFFHSFFPSFFLPFHFFSFFSRFPFRPPTLSDYSTVHDDFARKHCRVVVQESRKS